MLAINNKFPSSIYFCLPSSVLACTPYIRPAVPQHRMEKPFLPLQHAICQIEWLPVADTWRQRQQRREI
ncbi:hypothetical protein NEUTE1DRAFT_100540 [Neurospora tetrasperma FGSC 2508]|uniref:Uncharacterized protein n=1 Tax=Neurospora tetrasperma (strain FGSC 2508 / ATCC MYA-4615 / P0657) TaxID=510951 RepID=F8MLR8_NEUT8|nr:uncharacterized protein NEUTE1DRAFT_100540 [Neurospora tetrasperma FGSC 2508]EGO57637.1 hypothetical protein NEUTE1DRAFT_100540 [Neurospora tetrasperma FGSC 2508]EGZ72094.1 hypothetical protein NEUTE2DRAFT_66709 [Neurospora tetrasperma FGSC 2509]